MEKVKLGLALCGSYCTYSKVIAAAKDLAEKYDLNHEIQFLSL